MNATLGNSRPLSRLTVVAIQLAVVAAFLAAWQYLPQIEWFSSRFRFLDPLFISSPSDVALELYRQTTGADDTLTIWTYVWPTLWASIIGTAIGVVGGLICGLALADSQNLSRIFRPFLIALNAVPRIALVPVFIILFGPTTEGTAAVCIAVVFFVAFFNAYEGASSVPAEVLQNVRLLGAKRFAIVTRVRFPYAAAWTFASLPLAITFAIITAVTAEVLIGTRGMGRLLLISMQTGTAALTFTVAIVLSVLGLIAVGITELSRRRILHWWRPS